jgi:amidase
MRVDAPELVCLVDESSRRALANEAKAYPQSSQLEGLSVGVKDLIDIASLVTAAGSPDWAASHPVPNSSAHSVLQLVAAGAQVVAKTQTDELAYSLNGINQHYQTPVNPAAPDRLPGGSSNGSAVAVANGTIDIGLGTDTGGSIRVPASYNGLFGLRPSHGLVASQGMVPLAPGFDTVGWLTRDFKTLKKVAGVLLPPAGKNRFQQLVILLPEGISDRWQTLAQVLVEQTAAEFSEIRLLPFPSSVMASASQTFRVLQGRQITAQHGQWLADKKPNIAPDIAGRFAWSAALSYEDERQAHASRQDFVAFWQQECGIHSNTLVALPTTPGAAPLLSESAESLADYRNQLLDQQAPWGLSFMAGKHQDQALLSKVASLLPYLDCLKGD